VCFVHYVCYAYWYNAELKVWVKTCLTAAQDQKDWTLLVSVPVEGWINCKLSCIFMGLVIMHIIPLKIRPKTYM
jgi:hypothetical protein